MMSTSAILVTAITLTISSLTSGASEDEFVKNLTDPTRYNAKVRPEGYQVVDNISAYITNIAHVDDIRREYLLQITLIQQWQDSRLNVDEMIEVDFQFPPKGYVSITDSLIWTPDIGFTNAVGKKDVIGLDKYIRIYPNGTVVFSERISLVMTCNMDFKYFPHDTQCCNVTIEAVAHTDDELHLEWRTDNPIEVNPNIEIPLWSIENFSTSSRNIQKHGGNFSCLDIMIDISRQSFGYYFLLVYFPIMTLVLIALLSLWVKEIRDRYLISFLPLLIITILFIYFQVKFPPISAPKWPMYSKIIDSWMSINLIFVFVTVIIHALIDYANLEGQYSDERERSPKLLGSHGNYDGPHNYEEAGGNDGRQSPSWSRKAWRHSDVLVSSRGILWLLRIVFPIAYFTFLGIYVISVWLVS